MGISLGGGCTSFIGGWVFHWGVDALLSLGDVYFIGGWILLFHCRMDISLGVRCSSFIVGWIFIGAWMLFFH